MFQLAAWFVHESAPAGERWNCTVATPEPVSAESLESVSVPRRFEPSSGAAMVPVGSVLSTRTVIAADVNVLPALSVVVMRKSYWPSATSAVFQLGAWFVHVPAPAGERWNCTVSTPEPASAELPVSAIVPRTFAAAAGLVTEPVGSVLSTRTWIVAGATSAFPAESVVKTRRS